MSMGVAVGILNALGLQRKLQVVEDKTKDMVVLGIIETRIRTKIET